MRAEELGSVDKALPPPGLPSELKRLEHTHRIVVTVQSTN